MTQTTAILSITKYMASEFKQREIYPHVTGAGRYEFSAEDIATIISDCEWRMESMVWELSPQEFLVQFNAYNALRKEAERAMS